jgi:hypothetical protein
MLIMTFVLLVFCMTLFVAYANGANDNFKGVASLYGANVADYKTAMTIATVATFAGCVASVFLAEALVIRRAAMTAKPAQQLRIAELHYHRHVAPEQPSLIAANGVRNGRWRVYSVSVRL